MEQAQVDAREIEFPRAVERYVQSLESLEEIRGLVGGLAWDATGFRLVIAVRTRE